MKFRDGMWLPIEGKRTEYAEDIYTITQRPDGRALSLLCPTKHIRSRGDTLNLPTVTLVSTLKSSNKLVAALILPFRISKLFLMALFLLRQHTGLELPTKDLTLTFSLPGSLKMKPRFLYLIKAQQFRQDLLVPPFTLTSTHSTSVFMQRMDPSSSLHC